MSDILLSQCFEQVIALPCWNAKRGHGSFITMEFGEPTLRVREPTGKLTWRTVTPVGQWHLWIYQCEWRISERTVELAHSESPNDAIEKAIAALDGQRLSALPALDSASKGWLFRFDLGGMLMTIPYDDYDDPKSDQWMLYEPTGDVLSSDQLGQLTRVRGDSANNVR